MARYIDADKCIEWLNTCADVWSRSDVEYLIDNSPTADVQPVIYAKWKIIPYFNGLVACSNCNGVAEKKSNFCPECGARMGGDTE